MGIYGINLKHKELKYTMDFKVDKIFEKNIIIVDDIISTWTTLNEMAKILKKNWAKKVIWLVIASD